MILYCSMENIDKNPCHLWQDFENSSHFNLQHIIANSALSKNLNLGKYKKKKAVLKFTQMKDIKIYTRSNVSEIK